MLGDARSGAAVVDWLADPCWGYSEFGCLADGPALCNVVPLEGEDHFEESERSIVDLKLMFFQTLYGWVNSLGFCSINSITELIDYCTF